VTVFPEIKCLVFPNRLTDILIHEALNLALGLGYRLGLLRAMANIDRPVMVMDVADKAGITVICLKIEEKKPKGCERLRIFIFLPVLSHARLFRYVCLQYFPSKTLYTFSKISFGISPRYLP